MEPTALPPSSNEQLPTESTNIASSFLVPGIIIGVVVVALAGLGWYGAQMLLTPGTPQVTAPSTNANSNQVPVQVTSSTVETEGVGKTQQIDEETRRLLEMEAGTNLKEAQSIAGREVGTTYTAQYARHMEHVRRLRNYLFINIQTLLSGNTNKEKILADYMNTLLGETSAAKDHGRDLQTTEGLLKTDLASYQAEQKRHNEAYKVAVSNYDPKGAAESLESFIAAQGMAAETYARMKATQGLLGIYTKILAATDTKMKFIAANKEALLREIAVVDIKSLEEKLILSEKEWLTSLEQ